MAEMRPACFAEKWHNWEIHATQQARAYSYHYHHFFYHFDQYYDYSNCKHCIRWLVNFTTFFASATYVGASCSNS